MEIRVVAIALSLALRIFAVPLGADAQPSGKVARGERRGT